MNKKIIVTTLASFILFPVLCLAGPSINTHTGNIATQSGYGPATATSLSEMAGSIIKTLLSFIGVIFLILTIYAGFLWMTAGGNEDSVGKARKILTFAVSGLIVILAAYSITWFVLGAVVGVTSPATSGGTGGSVTDPCLNFWYHYTHASCIF